MNLLKVVLIGLVLLAYSCTSQSNNESTDDSNLHHEYSHLDVELNKGKRWEANTETTEGIENMISLVNNSKVDADLSEYHQLAKELEIEFTTIFKKCTMKGEAHNQLHNYLIPLKNSIEGLKAEKVEVCQKNYKQIKKHLAAYNSFFN